MPVLKFQKVPELEHSSLKDEVFKNYLSLVKTLTAYQNFKYSLWLEHSTAIMEQAMQMEILKFVNATVPPKRMYLKTMYYRKNLCFYLAADHGRRSIIKSVTTTQSQSTVTPSSKTSLQQIRSQPKVLKISTAGHVIRWVSGKKMANQVMDKIRSQRSLTWHEVMGDMIVVEQNIEFALNFNDDLFSCIRGAELLDSLKYDLPDKIKMIASRKERLQKDVAAVKNVLEHYNAIMKKLSYPQVIQFFLSKTKVLFGR